MIKENAWNGVIKIGYLLRGNQKYYDEVVYLAQQKGVHHANCLKSELNGDEHNILKWICLTIMSINYRFPMISSCI